MLNEGDIKAAVIDKLFEIDALSDAVLINEMVIANWSRRADLVVANGKLHAFEIKSDLDSLRRLEGQLETYLNRFDKVTVVSTPKFINAIRDIADERVEIWVAVESTRGIVLKIARRGRTNPVRNKKILCEYFLKSELVSLLSENGVAATIEMPRSNLESIAESLSVKALRDYVLRSLKLRYKETFEIFCENKSDKTKPNDIQKLSKLGLKTVNETVSMAKPAESIWDNNINRVDLGYLASKFGPLPVDMPEFVRKRVDNI